MRMQFSNVNYTRILSYFKFGIYSSVFIVGFLVHGLGTHAFSEESDITASSADLPEEMRKLRQKLAELDELLPPEGQVGEQAAYDAVHVLLTVLEGVDVEETITSEVEEVNSTAARDTLQKLKTDLRALEAAASIGDDNQFRRVYKSIDLLATCNSCHINLGKASVN